MKGIGLRTACSGFTGEQLAEIHRGANRIAD
jgi:hypothetical protein